MDLNKEIVSLPCFSDYECEIEPCLGGESHQAFKVSCYSANTSASKAFFVKYIPSHSGDIQQHYLDVDDEVKVQILAIEQGISPDIIYKNQHWIVTQWLQGRTLFVSEKALSKKVTIAIKLIDKLHQVPFIAKELDLTKVFHELLAECRFMNDASADLYENLVMLTSQLCESIDQLSKSISDIVQCHGDVNFNNIMMVDQQAWLIDFECTCSAEREFELAMFIAINQLRNERQIQAIAEYQQLSGVIISEQKLTYYLACSYLINGLWYCTQVKQDEHSNAKQLKDNAKQQLTLFSEHCKKRQLFQSELAHIQLTHFVE